MFSHDETEILRHIRVWATFVTDPASPRWNDLLKDKIQSNQHFFTHIRKAPAQVEVQDVRVWVNLLFDEGLAPATIRRKVSYLRSFFKWLILDQHQPIFNPVEGVRVKRPHPVQATQALSDQDFIRVLGIVLKRASRGEITAKRDLFLLLIAFVTEMKRSEILRLQRQHLEVTTEEVLIRPVAQKNSSSLSIHHSKLCQIAQEHLTLLQDVSPYTPLWTRHDRAGKSGTPLTSQGFGGSLRGYTEEAGLKEASFQDLRTVFKRMTHSRELATRKKLTPDAQLAMLFEALLV